MSRKVTAGMVVCAAAALAIDPPIAIVDVNVIPMNSERVLPRYTVVVTGDRISSVGPADQVRIPPGAVRIQAKGKYLMPGLVDAHVHLQGGRPASDASLLLYVANGVTSVRVMNGSSALLALREQVKGGLKIGPTIYSTGVLIDGNPPFRREISRVVETAEQANEAVEQDLRAGFEAVKVYDGLTPEAFRYVAASARTAGLPLYGHPPNTMELDTALQLGMRSVEHFEGWMNALQREGSPHKNKRTILAFDEIDLGKLPAIIQAFKVAGAWNCPTFVVSRADGMTPEEIRKLADLPHLSLVSEQSRKAALAAVDRAVAKPASEDNRLRFRRRREFYFRLTRMLHDAGVGILAGSDGPRTFVTPGFSLHEELGYLVEAGLTPYAALRAATAEPAACLQKAGEFGRIAPGLRADLVLLHENPLLDVRNAARRVGVMVRGKWLPEDSLRQLLTRAASE